MPAYPYDTLMRYKRWATNGLNAVVAGNVDRIGAGDMLLIRRLLDHIQTVDAIFSDNLAGRPHGHAAPRSIELPAFETLDFAFTNGAPGQMTRGDMLLHVATHGTYHRGNIGIILQKNGIAPNPDRLTDFLERERTLEAA